LIFVNRFFFPDHSATIQILCEVHVVTSTHLYDDAKAALPSSEFIDGVRVQPRAIDQVWTQHITSPFDRSTMSRSTGRCGNTWSTWHSPATLSSQKLTRR
jgi:hypothetical protein